MTGAACLGSNELKTFINSPMARAALGITKAHVVFVTSRLTSSSIIKEVEYSIPV